MTSSWKDNGDILSTFYAYPPKIRKIIYTMLLFCHGKFTITQKRKSLGSKEILPCCPGFCVNDINLPMHHVLFLGLGYRF